MSRLVFTHVYALELIENNKKMKHLLIIFILATFSLAVFAGGQSTSSAYESRTSNVQVSNTGIVVKVLSDDKKGSRHQRFILKLPSGQTILIAHNIDFAPKITSINTGDSVEFYGEYEWNAKGGVVHWTHHDSAGRHEGGWLKHNGVLYE